MPPAASTAPAFRVCQKLIQMPNLCTDPWHRGDDSTTTAVDGEQCFLPVRLRVAD